MGHEMRYLLIIIYTILDFIRRMIGISAIIASVAFLINRSSYEKKSHPKDDTIFSRIVIIAESDIDPSEECLTSLWQRVEGRRQ
jgi:hypothetical protein